MFSEFPHVHKTWIIEQIRQINPKNVLDVGCAGGNGLWFYSKEFPDIDFTGVDFLAENVDNNREFFKDRKVEFQKADIRQLPFKDKEFDLVICDSVINTLDRKDDITAAKELMRVGKKVLLLEQNGTEKDFGNNYAHDYKTLFPNIKFIMKVQGYGDPTWDEFGYLMLWE